MAFSWSSWRLVDSSNPHTNSSLAPGSLSLPWVACGDHLASTGDVPARVNGFDPWLPLWLPWSRVNWGQATCLGAWILIEPLQLPRMLRHVEPCVWWIVSQPGSKWHQPDRANLEFFRPQWYLWQSENVRPCLLRVSYTSSVWGLDVWSRGGVITPAWARACRWGMWIMNGCS